MKKNNQKVLKIVDAAHWLKYAAVREDKRLNKTFVSYEGTLLQKEEITEEDQKYAIDLLYDFWNLNYRLGLRDDIEQFCEDYEMSEQTNVIVYGNNAIVEIDGVKGISFNLQSYRYLAALAE